MVLRALLLSEELIDGLLERSLTFGWLGVGQHDPGIHRLQLQLLLRQSLDRIVWVGTSLPALPFPTVVPFDFPVPTRGVDLGTLYRARCVRSGLPERLLHTGLRARHFPSGVFVTRMIQAVRRTGCVPSKEEYVRLERNLREMTARLVNDSN